MRACPYCAEQIQDAAVICRYCGRTVGEAPTSASAPTEKSTPSSMGEGSALASTGQTVKVSSPVGAILAIVGGAALFAGAFLPYAEGDSLASFYEGEAIQLILTYLLPPVLVIAAGVVGLSSPSLRQFAAGVAAAIGLTQLAGWVGTLISVDGVDWGIGLWAFMLGAGLSLAGGVILVVQARASATTPMAGPRQT